jgi:hypothetical protein
MCKIKVFWALLREIQRGERESVKEEGKGGTWDQRYIPRAAADRDT